MNKVPSFYTNAPDFSLHLFERLIRRKQPENQTFEDIYYFSIIDMPKGTAIRYGLTSLSDHERTKAKKLVSDVACIGINGPSHLDIYEDGFASLPELRRDYHSSLNANLKYTIDEQGS